MKQGTTKEEAHEAIRRAGYVANVVNDISVVPMWTGTEFNFSRRSPAAWDIHEVFHLAVANKAQRQRPDFGLGRHVDAKYVQPEYSDRNAAWDDEFVISLRLASRLEVLACDLFPVFGLMFPGGRLEALAAALDFGCLGYGKYHRHGRGRRAVSLGYDVLSKFVDVPEPDLANYVSSTWDEWYSD